ACSRALRVLPSFPIRRSSDLALLTLLGRILAPALLSLLLLAALFGFFLERLLGGRELEVLEQPPRQFGEGGLIVERHRQSVELRSEEHTSELQSRFDLVCRLL